MSTHEALDEIYKMPLHSFRPEAILGAASPYFGLGLGDVYGLSWGLNCFLVLLVTPKLMVKLK